MGILELSSLSEKRPEEIVRQAWFDRLVELGFPKHLIVVEKTLQSLAPGMKVPNRRVDLLCYGPAARPLLLIECKVAPFTEGMQRQLMGYNAFVKAPFMALVNGEGALMAAASTLEFTSGIPTYKELLSSLSACS